MKFLYYNLTSNERKVDEKYFLVKKNKENFDNDFENVENQYIEETDKGIYLHHILCTRYNRRQLKNIEIEHVKEQIGFAYINYYEEKPVFILDNQKYENDLKSINITSISDIHDYLYVSRNYDSLIEYYYISFNNMLIMKNIKFKRKYKIIKNIGESFDNCTEGSYLTMKTLCYVMNSKIPKLSEQYIIIKVKDKEEIKEDLLNRNKTFTASEYIIIENNEKMTKNIRLGYNSTIKLNSYDTRVPIFVYNKRRYENAFDEHFEEQIKYVDVNSEEEIKEYLFNRKDNSIINDYYIWKESCICKNTTLSYNDHGCINHSTMDMEISDSYIRNKDMLSLITRHMRLHRKIAGCNF